MTVQGLAVVLDDDIGVLLEDADELLAGRDLFVVEDSAFGLGDDSASQVDVVTQLGLQCLDLCHLLDTARFH